MPYRRLTIYFALLLGGCRAQSPATQSLPANGPAPIHVLTEAEIRDQQLEQEKIARVKHLAAVISGEEKSETDKIRACWSLQLLGPSAAGAADELAAALAYPDPIRSHAGRALIAIGPAAIPALRKWIAEVPGPQRYIAADIWAQIDVDAGVTSKVLEDRLANGKPIDRVEAAVALQAVHQREMMELIIAHHRSTPDKIENSQVLVKADDARAVIRKLAELAIKPDAPTQLRALDSLAQWGPAASDVAGDIRPLMESNREVALAATKALSQMGSAGIGQFLIELKSDNGNAGNLAILALGNISGDIADQGMRLKIVDELVAADKRGNEHVNIFASLRRYWPDSKFALEKAAFAGDNAAKTQLAEQFIFDPASCIFVVEDPGGNDERTKTHDTEFGRLIAPRLLGRMNGATLYEKWHLLTLLSLFPSESVDEQLTRGFRLLLADPNIGPLRAELPRKLTDLGPSGLPALISACGPNDVELRRSAIVELSARSDATGSPKVISAMVQALGDPSELVRRNALEWAKKLRSPTPEIMKHVAGFLNQNDPAFSQYVDDRVTAANMLASCRTPDGSGLAALVGGLSDPSVRVTYASVISLRSYGEQAAIAVPLLTKILTSGDEPFCGAAAETLMVCGSAGRRAAAPYYLRIFAAASDDGDHRLALATLPQLGPDAAPAVPQLIKWLDSSDNTLRVKVAGALAAIGPQAADAIPALSRMTGNIREDVGQAASEALVSISPNGKGLAPALMSAVYNRDGVSVKRLAAAMASSKDATAIMPALKTLATNDPDAGTRASAQRAIVWLAPAPTTQEVPKQGDK